MKKIIAFVLVTVFLLCFAACASEETEDVELVWDSENENFDFDGHVFRLCGDISDKSATFLSFFKDTNFGDAAMQRFRDVEKQYNCTILKSDVINSVEEIFAHAAAGSTGFDFFVEHIFYGGNEFKNTGVLMPISSVSDIIDITDSYKWGTPNMQEEFTYKDDTYGLLPMAWPEINFMSLDFFLVFDTDITNYLGLEDPREYMEKGEWTRDRFEQVLFDYTFIDNSGNEVKAFSFDSRHLIDLGLKSFGVKLCRMDDNGKWVSDYVSQNGYEALDWCRKIAFEPEFDPCIYHEGVGNAVKLWVDKKLSIAFLTANYAFSTSSSGDASCEVAYSGIPFSLLTFPSEDGKTVISQHERTINAVLFPSWGSSPEGSAFLVNEIFEPIAGLNNLEQMISYYSDNLFFDRRDTELVFSMQKVSRYLFHDEGINDFNRSIYSSLMKSTGTAVMDKNSDIVDRLLEKEIIPVKEGMFAIFGYED